MTAKITADINLYLFRGRFSGYIESALESRINISSTYIIFLIFYFLFIYSYKKWKKDENMNFYFRIMSVGIALGLMGQKFPNMFRVSYYFIIVLIAKIDDLINIIFTEKNYEIVKIILIFLLGFQYYYFGPGAGTDSYQFFWLE